MRITAKPIMNLVPVVQDNGTIMYVPNGLSGLGIDPVSAAAAVGSTIASLFKARKSKLSHDQFFDERAKVIEPMVKAGVSQDCVTKILIEDGLSYKQLRPGLNIIRNYAPEYDRLINSSVPKILKCSLINGSISQAWYDAFIGSGSVTVAQAADKQAQEQQKQLVTAQAAMPKIDTKTALIGLGVALAAGTAIYFAIR